MEYAKFNISASTILINSLQIYALAVRYNYDSLSKTNTRILKNDSNEN